MHQDFGQFAAFAGVRIYTTRCKNTLNDVWRIEVIKETVLTIGIAQHEMIAGRVNRVAKLFQTNLREVIKWLFRIIVETAGIVQRTVRRIEIKECLSLCKRKDLLVIPSKYLYLLQ